ncbi:MAG: thermostable hemolysin, partial [Pontiellaceae bacterium]|nr:thermostable hemolysin [Pontiellaceae bacterium]
MAEQNSLFIESSINPLLEDLAEAMQLLDIDALHSGRIEIQEFIRGVFLQAHQAELSVFYPNLLAFNTNEQVR